MIEVATQHTSAPTADQPATMKQGNENPGSPLERFRSQLRQRYHLPGQPAAPRD
jgi:hypothetical protein